MKTTIMTDGKGNPGEQVTAIYNGMVLNFKPIIAYLYNSRFTARYIGDGLHIKYLITRRGKPARMPV